MTLNTVDKSNQEDCISSSNSQDSNVMNFNRPSSSNDNSNDEYNLSNNLLSKETKSETSSLNSLNKDDFKGNEILNNEQDDTLMEIESVPEKDVELSSEKLDNDDTLVNDLVKSPSKTKKKGSDRLESGKKRSKSTHKKQPKEDKSSTSPLIREPKLQINDKTLKKLKTKTDDLIFEDTNSSSTSSTPSKYTSANHTPIKSNKFTMPVVSNVLSRSLEAIFNSSNKKNSEFNSYSALGFNNRGPRVKRVCRKFDVFQGLPRAVFPSIPQKPTANKSTSSKSMNNSPNKRNKNKKTTPNKNQSSASTSKSNSNSSLKAEDDLESNSSYSSDDLDITEYIARNLKREMESSSKDIC